MLERLTCTRASLNHSVQFHSFQNGGRHVSTMSAIKRGIGRSNGTSRAKVKDTDTFATRRQSKYDPSRSSSISRFSPRNTRDDSLPPQQSSFGKSRYGNAGRPASFPRVKPSGTRHESRTPFQHSSTRSSFSPSRKHETTSPFHQNPAQSTFSSSMRNESRAETDSQRSDFRFSENRTPRRSFPRSDQQLRIRSPGEGDMEQHFGTRAGYQDDSQFGSRDNRRDRQKEKQEDRGLFGLRISKNSVKILRTTAASEFIYGRSSVLAALKAGSRQFYNLYLARSTDDQEKTGSEDLYKHALNNDTKVTWLTGSDGVSEMDKTSKGRPHNGVILEASPLPRLPISALGEARKGRSFEIALRHQSREEEEVNGSNTQIALESAFPRYPFVIMLDEVVDQGNLGGILRSAYFLGVDGVVLSSHMAAMNAVALKAASGAAEGIKLFSVHNTTGFIEASKENGWIVYAAIAPPSARSGYKAKHVELNNLGSPLQDGPCILLLGGEGDGLRRDLIMKADQTVSINGQRSHQGGVDSLNVSVAAGILMDAFLKEPTDRPVDERHSGHPETSYKSNLLF